MLYQDKTARIKTETGPSYPIFLTISFSFGRRLYMIQMKPTH